MQNEEEIDRSLMQRQLLMIVLSSLKIKMAEDRFAFRIPEWAFTSYFFNNFILYFKKNRIKYQFEDFYSMIVMYSGPTVIASASRKDRKESIYYNFSRNEITR